MKMESWKKKYNSSSNLKKGVVILEGIFLKIKEFIKNYYEYTTEISITEFEYFENFNYLEGCSLKETTREDYLKESYKDLLYDLIFNQNAIKEQILNDIENYNFENLESYADKTKDNAELEYIEEFYFKNKEFLNFDLDFFE